MAEDKRYSIISVVDDEEDDVVIQAGAVPQGGDAAEEGGEDPFEDAAEREGAPADAEDAGPGDGAAEEEPALSPEERRRLARASARQAEMERLRQTEESLSAAPEQPRMRKAVLAVLAVGVVAFAVCYYVFFMA